METYLKHFEAARQEIERHTEDAEVSKAAHFLIADRYSSIDSAMQRVAAISFSGVVLSWFISTQIYTVFEGLTWSVHPTVKIFTQTALPVGFVITNLIATTFLFLNRYSEKACHHREAAQKYHRFYRKCLNWRTDCPDPTYVNKLVALANSYREELSEINRTSPDVEEWAWKNVDNELEKGGTTYDVDKERIIKP